MRTLLVLLSLALVGCAPTRYPLLLSSSLVRTTDRLARVAIDALARHDRAKLAELGMDETHVAQAFAESPQLAAPAQPKFLTDYPIGRRYVRQYAVDLATGGQVEIRVGFKDDQHPRVTDFEFVDRTP